MKGGVSGRKKYIKKYTNPISEQGSLYGGEATTDSCKSLTAKTNLQKLTPAARSLAVGDELTIAKRRAELLAVNDAGDICGSIASTANASLLECMDKGYTYIAIVKSVSGGIINVVIQSG